MLHANEDRDTFCPREFISKLGEKTRADDAQVEKNTPLEELGVKEDLQRVKCRLLTTPAPTPGELAIPRLKQHYVTFTLAYVQDFPGGSSC